MSLRQQNKLKARTAILKAASELIATHGPDATTTREIAKHAGVSYQTLYNYFPNKGLLLKDLLTEEVTSLGEEMDQIIKRYDGDLFGTLRLVHDKLVALITGDRHEVWVSLTRSMLNANFTAEIDRDDMDMLIGIAHERYHALLSLAQGMGQLKPEADLHLIAHTLFCLNDHAMLMLMIKHTDQEAILATLDEQAKLILAAYVI
ncbi:MAG: TetR/AcrR family transcriptional regulator [Pseudomonadota bacterium]